MGQSYLDEQSLAVMESKAQCSLDKMFKVINVADQGRRREMFQKGF